MINCKNSFFTAVREQPASTTPEQPTFIDQAPVLKVLVIDDCSLQRRFLSRLFEELGVHVECAISIEAALELLKYNNFDAVISDMELSDEESGLEFMEKFKETRGEFADRIPIIAVSSNENYRKIALDSGFNKFLKKPISIQNCLDILLTIGKLNKEPINKEPETHLRIQ